MLSKLLSFDTLKTYINFDTNLWKNQIILCILTLCMLSVTNKWYVIVSCAVKVSRNYYEYAFKTVMTTLRLIVWFTVNNSTLKQHPCCTTSSSVRYYNPKDFYHAAYLLWRSRPCCESITHNIGLINLIMNMQCKNFQVVFLKYAWARLQKPAPNCEGPLWKWCSAWCPTAASHNSLWFVENDQSKIVFKGTV